jgi:hypothetical protein
MPRYLVMNRRNIGGHAASARDAVSSEPGVSVVSAVNPDVVTIEANEDVANHLREKLRHTHYVEAEVRRSLH